MTKCDVERLLDKLTLAGESDQAPRVLFIRANGSQKAFIARALRALECLNEAVQARSLQMSLVLDALVPLECEAAERSLLELAESTRAANLLTTSLLGEADINLLQRDTLERLVRLLSALLLRVYITGTDAGGHLEREQAQRLVRKASPHNWGLAGATASWTAH